MRRNFEASLEVLSDFADLVRNVTLPEYPSGAAASIIRRTDGHRRIPPGY